MQYFSAAFSATSQVLCYIAGSAAAIGILLLALAIMAGVAAWIFNRVTAAIGRRWRRRGKQPRSRIGKIIYYHSAGDI